MTNNQTAAMSGAPDPQDEASFWFARLRSDECSDQDQQQFADWLASDPSHEQHYNQACGVWSTLGELAEEAEIVQLRLQALAHAPREPLMSKWRWPALAASVVLMLMVGVAVPGLITPDPASQFNDTNIPVAASPVIAVSDGPVPEVVAPEAPAAVELATSYRTAIGEHSVFTLPDGSVIELNTNTHIRVIYTKDRRDFDLLRGEAIFRVAKSKSRPFVVQTNDNRVTALGTVFAVRRDANQTTVTLLEGKVKVEQFARKSVGSAAAQVTNLIAGQQLLTSQNTGHQVRNADTVAAASWAEGRLYFDNQKLSDVITELNRYTTKRLELGEADLANMRVSGQFRTSYADTFAQTLAASFPVETTENDGGERIVLTRAKR